MAFPSPPPAPQRGDRTTFSNRVDAFLTWLTNLVPQMNTFLAGITSLAAGGANAFSYTFDTATADAAPGAGKIRLNSTTENVSTVLRVAAGSGDGADVTMFMRALQTGSSNIKASVRLQKLGSVNSYLIFDITNVAEMAGYFNLTVTPRVSTVASPFAANDTLALFFDMKGDRGDGGNTPTQQQIRDAVGTLPIANGGTSATTASAALAALGAFPAAGGNITGNAVFNNASGIFGRDTGGSPHQVLNFGGDNNVNCVIGTGGFWRIYDSTGANNQWDLDNAGNTRQKGNAVFENTKGVWLKDTSGTARPLVTLGGDNNVNFSLIGPAGYLNFYNLAGNSIIAGLSNSGVFTATSFTSTSDERKKKNWRRLTDAQLDALADLEDVGLFDWIDGTGTALGGRAQQIQKIVPEVVKADAKGMLSVEYGALAFVIAQSALRRSREAE